MGEQKGTLEDVVRDMDVRDFYKGKKVLVTGHMGFKGSWLCKILILSGAEVIGYGIDNGVEPSLFQISHIAEAMTSITGDIRDLSHLKEVFYNYQPEIVFHMAAQPIVRLGYKDPVNTYSTNVMGTVNLLECIRLTKSVRSVVNITTDKVYHNKGWGRGYREEDELNGQDPYSNSKSCSELVTSSYSYSFLPEVPISTLRAGNVLGGGDFSQDRIIPDCVRAVLTGKAIEVRNPNSIRPYEHVLEALAVYLMVARGQYCDKSLAGSYNVGPNAEDCVTTAELVTLFCNDWGETASWQSVIAEGPREADFLKLDCTKLQTVFNWKPHWDIKKTIQQVVAWSKAYEKDGSAAGVMEEQIREFFFL
ncbi:MAG: CDP-glucose 4,6-dehydratase [Lachnospiraceae bacterium]